MAVVLALAPFTTSNSYSNLYVFPDALFLLNGAYAITHGFIPHVDFPWHLGGYELYLIAASFKLFGQSFKALEYAVSLAYLINISLLFLALFRIARPLTFATLALLVSATVLTRFPFEISHPDTSVQSLAMFYNRICWGLAICLFSTLLIGQEPLRKRQIFACATCMFLILVTKATFALLFPVAIFLLVRRSGWIGLVQAALFGLALALAAWVLTGYGPQAYIGFIRDMADVTETLRAEAAFGPFSKIVRVTLYNLVPLTALVVMGALLLWAMRREGATNVGLISLAAVLILSICATAFTGSYYAVAATTPMIAFASLMLADMGLGLRRTPMQARQAFYLGGTIWAVAFSFIYLMNYAAAVVKEATRGEQAFFRAGPLAGLVIDQMDTNRTATFNSAAEARQYIFQRATLEGSLKWADDYEWQYVFADAVALAMRTPGLRCARVAAFYPTMFPFVLNSAPAPSFPFWPTEGSSALAQANDLRRHADAVMILSIDRQNALQERFKPVLLRDYAFQGRSAFWEMYVRPAGRPECGPDRSRT